MKLLFLAGADSVHSWRWIEYFADRGHEIHWISLVPFPRPATKGIRTYEVGRYPSGPWSLARAIWNTRRIGRAVQPDVFHVHSIGTYGVVGMMTGIRPLLATPWGSDVLIATRQRINRWLVSMVLRRADLMTCDAYHMRDAMIDLGADPSKIRVIYFGTDVERFRKSENGSKPSFFPPDAEVVVLSTRTLHPMYDVGSLIRAAPIVLEKVPGARFVIVGQGEELEALTRLSGELGLANRVVFAGAIPATDIPGVVAAADIYVSTSLSDAGLAASTAEAMASALPVVVTNSAENHLWVEEGVGGFVVPTKEPAVLADRIIRLARDADLRERSGRHNRKVIEERNNYYVEMRKVETAYQELAAAYA